MELSHEFCVRCNIPPNYVNYVVCCIHYFLSERKKYPLATVKMSINYAKIVQGLFYS